MRSLKRNTTGFLHQELIVSLSPSLKSASPVGATKSLGFIDSIQRQNSGHLNQKSSRITMNKKTTLSAMLLLSAAILPQSFAKTKEEIEKNIEEGCTLLSTIERKYPKVTVNEMAAYFEQIGEPHVSFDDAKKFILYCHGRALDDAAQKDRY